MLEIFTPYLPAIVIVITLGVNLLLIFTKTPWWGYLIANLIIVAVLGAVDLAIPSEFNIFELVVEAIIDLVITLFRAIFNLLFGWLKGCDGVASSEPSYISWDMS